MGSSRDATAEGRRREPHQAPRPYAEGDMPRDGNDEDFLFHLFRGSELLQDGRELEAKEELEQALMRKPGDEKGQDLLAFVYFRIGIYPRAIAIYEHLRQKSPHDPALHLNLSLCYLKTGQPERARDELEALVAAHADHPRAWGYLGLALERLGEYARAQLAFEKSGHAHLARRMMERAAAKPDALRPNLGSEPARDVRAFAKEAYEELDAGQLDFALAEPHASSREVEDWRAIELGGHPPSTRDGPPGGVASMASPVSLAEPVRRRQTLVVAPPPPGTHIDTFLVAPPSRVPVPVSDPSITWTSRPAEIAQAAVPPSVRAPASVFPPPSASQFAKAALLVPRDEGAVSLHGNGSVIARPTRTRPFATRLEAIRTMTGALDSKILERRRDGASVGETFGGLGSPLVELAGDGQVIVGPKPGHVLSSFVLEGVPCTLREDRVLGFELGLVYENDKLVLPSAELRTVRFSGAGALVIEAQSPIATIEVAHDRPVVARREVVVGWIGHLDVAPVLPADAPGAHHGLLRLTGSGSVLVSGL